jgi:subtilisin family serine protease
VVAILDTGVGEHDWLPEDIVRTDASVFGIPIGLQDPSTNPEWTGCIDDPLVGMLDSDSGHGTFIAGLIRQRCPDADILALRVMPSDGAVAESDLLHTLNLLALRQIVAQAQGDADNMIDVLTLSLGYYHESPEDLKYDPHLLVPLRILGETGVSVVVAAGNDCTARPMFPAAFTPYDGGYVAKSSRDCVPIVSVGALNPDGTIAMFSNGGEWVHSYRPGAALVSTFPKTFNGATGPALRVHLPGEGWRATMDPDDFSGGFGTWSGTSFAAPLLAADIAQSLVDGGCGSLDSVDRTNSLKRGWKAVARHTKLARP